MSRARLATLVLALAFALGFGLWRQASFDPVGDAFENSLLDLRFRVRGAIAPPAAITIVAIDEAAVSRIGTMAPLRTALAEALERIEAAAPAAVAINLLLLDRTAADARLARVLAASDRALLAVATTDEAEAARTTSLPEVLQSLARSAFPVVAGARPARRPDLHPFLPHAGLAGAAELGHVNIARSADRVARQIPLALPIAPDEGHLPALSLAAVRLAESESALALLPGSAVRLGDRRIDTDADGQVTLNHYGPPGSIRTVSLGDLLAGAVAPSAFAGRLVFVGATAESLRDLYATPFAPDVPGVEILATLAGNLIDDNLVQRDTAASAWSILLGLLLALLAWRAAWLRRPWAALAATLLVWFGGAVLMQLAFAPGLLWLDGSAVLAATLFATAISGFTRHLSDLQTTHRLSREHANLSHYLSPVMARQLASRPAGEMDDRTQDAAVLFLDVAGYTALAETMTPGQVSIFLGRLHAHAEAAVAAHGGAIVEFLGDGVLAVFGLPAPAPADAAAALVCGAALLDDHAPSYPVTDDGRPSPLRVSVHYGPVGMAVLGGRRHGHFTVTGDTVNVAARLQEVAKQHGEAFVATRQAIDAAALADGVTPPHFTRLTEVSIRGRRQATEVWVRRDPDPSGR
ncbi:CHASE2 domain-containing protein [Marinibaculum pumilum]|uniref:CHASE2 domain-containing protein n=1 Tax=Marinibaculum pumilum TaxID=1766165 RepID=A0ABV7L8K5_9PROT